MCVISVLACRVFVVSKQQLTHRRSLSCCSCSPCVLDQQRCISCVTLKLSLNTDSALSCALVLSRNIWESALLSFAKTNQLCWQKKAEASLRLHPFYSHTHTHASAHSYLRKHIQQHLAMNLVTFNKQLHRSSCWHGKERHIRDEEEEEEEAERERGGATSFLLKNIKSKWTLAYQDKR